MNFTATMRKNRILKSLIKSDKIDHICIAVSFQHGGSLQD